LNKIKILKFGGAVLSNLEGFKNMLNIIKAYSNVKVMLVISAIAKSTSNLRLAGTLASNGKLKESQEIIDKLINEYIYFVENLIIDEKYRLENINEIISAKVEIYNLLKGINITQECTPRTYDLLMSYGEKMTLLIAHKFLKVNGINIEKIDSTGIIKTNSKYGNASPLMEITNSNIQNHILPKFKEFDFIIAQGFVASDLKNEITTMGIESSNLSAAIYSKCLNCNEIIIFTDVDGIRTADPKTNKITNLIEKLSYKQAFLIGQNGLKLIYPRMITFAQKAKIKVRIKSGLNNSISETIISEEKEIKPFNISIENGTKFLLKININNSNNRAMLSATKIQLAISKYLAEKIEPQFIFKIIAIENSYCLIELPDYNPDYNNIKEIKECNKITTIDFNSAVERKYQNIIFNYSNLFYYNSDGKINNYYFLK